MIDNVELTPIKKAIIKYQKENPNYKEYKRQYYLKNKEKITNRANLRLTCDTCKKEYSLSNALKHKKSKYHLEHESSDL